MVEQSVETSDDIASLVAHLQQERSSIINIVIVIYMKRKRNKRIVTVFAFFLLNVVDFSERDKDADDQVGGSVDDDDQRQERLGERH